jgi:hypothetical protein
MGSYDYCRLMGLRGRVEAVETAVVEPTAQVAETRVCAAQAPTEQRLSRLWVANLWD